MDLLSLLIGKKLGSGGGEVQESVAYAFSYNPTTTGSVPSYGTKFIPKMSFDIKGIRIKAQGSPANVYLSLADGTIIAQKTNVSVNVGEWNDVFFDNSITPNIDTEYVMWVSDASSKAFSMHGMLYSKPFITLVGSYKSNTADTFPTTTWASWSTPDWGGVDLIISKTGTDKFVFYSQLCEGVIPYDTYSFTANIKRALPSWTKDLSDNTKNFITNNNCYGAVSTSSGANQSCTLDAAFTAFSYEEYLAAKALTGDFVEYPSFIYDSPLLSQYNITLLGDFSQGGANTGNVLLDSITNYSGILLQGVYNNQRTSSYNITALYPPTLNTSLYTGMKDRNGSHHCDVTFTDDTTCSLAGNKQVIIYGIDAKVPRLFTLAYYAIDGNGTTYHIKDEIVYKNSSVSISAEKITSLLNGIGTYQDQYKLSLEDEYTAGLPSFQVVGDTNLYMLVDSISWIMITQDYTSDENYTWTVNDTTATLEFTYQGGNVNNLAGIMFDILNEDSVAFTNGGSGNIQNGVARKTATLPTIVTAGADRISYNSSASGTLTRTDTDYKFFITRYGLTVGNTVTFTFTKTQEG